MKIAVYLRTIQLKFFAGWHAQRVMRGFARGIKCADPAANIEIVTDDRVHDADLAVIFGAPHDKDQNPWNVLRHSVMAAHSDKPDSVFIIETPLLGRNVYTLQHKEWRVGLNGFTHRANFLNTDSPAQRWDLIQDRLGLTMAPYRRDGRHILVVGQTPDDASLFGMDVAQWMASTVDRLRTLTTRPIVVRPHPRSRKKLDLSDRPGVRISNAKFIEDDLRDAWAMAALTSSSTIDALMAGVPVFTENDDNMAWPVANHDLTSIEDPTLFDRDQWIHDLAYAQWSNQELAGGGYWRHIIARHPRYSSVREEGSPDFRI